MNPRVVADYDEVARWLLAFVSSHAKRESARIEAALEPLGDSYGLRLVLDGLSWPLAGEAGLVLTYAEVAQGRTRFAWCDDLRARIRAAAAGLLDEVRQRRSRSA
jgi:hypothetical protein